MSNIGGDDVAGQKSLGPRPTVRATGISRARAALLDHLIGQGEPRTIGALAQSTGLHGNTIREHLDGLVDVGLVVREQMHTEGRGRPAWLYSATASDRRTAGNPEYAGLATALAGHLQRTSQTPGDDAVEAGTQWGSELARGPRHTGDTPRHSLVRLLDELGFAPEPAEGADAIRLTRCPLLDAATRFSEVVCGVHLGIVRGALDVYGGDPRAGVLTPFAEPGACLLKVLAPPDPDLP